MKWVRGRCTIIITVGILSFSQGFAQTVQVATKDESDPVALMRAVEPGYIPKDDRAVQLFLLQKTAAKSEELIKKKNESTRNAREIFTTKFRQDLAHFTGLRTMPREAKLQSYVDEAIKHYETALKYHPNHQGYRADALYNLGRFYFEHDEKDYFDKLAAYNAAREQGRDDVAYPEEDFHRTIDAYEDLIENYPDFKQLDSAYYLLGLALWYEGAFNQAVSRFQELIAHYPQSHYVEEVWFRLGEFFYDMDDFDDAINAYEKVANNPQSKLYDKALYKIAWSHYQKDRFMRAIDYFIKVLTITYLETGEGALFGMRTEVTRYIVKSFSEQLVLEGGAPQPKKTKPKPAKDEKLKNQLSGVEKDYAEKLGLKLSARIGAYFAALNNPPFTRDVLIEMASQLLEESKIDGAVVAFEKIIELDKNHPDNPKFASQIVDILQEAERHEEARERNQIIIEQYGKNSSWYKAQANNYPAQRLAREAVRDAMLALAVYYHKTGKDQKIAQDTQNAEINFRNAAQLYADYVQEYPERDDTHKAIFYFAESAFELNRFRTALDAYQLLKDYPLPMPDNIRRDATLNIVFTFRHVLESEAQAGRFKAIDFDNLTSKQRGASAGEIPELGNKYLLAIDEFLKLSPSDEQVPVLLFHAAAIFYVYGQSDEAVTRFYYIIDTYPQTTAAMVAARLIIDDAVSKEQWAKVVELSRRFAAMNLGGQKADFSKVLGNARFKIARGVFEEANELQKNNQLALAKGKYRESAELFAALLQEDPKSAHADIMLFNSARAVVLSGTMAQALPLYKRLYTEHPQSEYAKVARFQEALALEKMLKFTEAARAYDGIIKEDPASEAAGDAMLNKALLYEAAGEVTSASSAFVEFAKRYPKRAEAPDALLSAASMYKRVGKTKEQIAILEQFIRQYSKDNTKTSSIVEAHVEIADTYADLEKSAGSVALKKRYEKDRNDNYKKAVALYSPELGSPAAAFFAAKAQSTLEKSEQDSFKQMTINARVGKAQGEQLTAMMKRLAELSAKNEGIIKAYAQPVWNAESLRRIGVLYEHLAKSMLKAPCPKDVEAVDEFACDEYMVLLEDKAAVLEEKALTASKQSYEIAMSAYDSPPDLINSILAALNRLRPGEYQRVGDVIEKPVQGEVFGSGRMLSDGRMAAFLHEKELDPDKKSAPLEESGPEATKPNDTKKEKEKELSPEEGMIKDSKKEIE